MSAVLAAGLLVLLAGAVLPLASARLGALASCAGSILLAVAGVATAAGSDHVSLGIGSWLGFGPAGLAADGLAGIFLTLVGIAGAAVSLALVERPPRRAVALLHGALLLALAAVLTADQAFVFLLAWEAVTVCLLLLAAAEAREPWSVAAAYFTGTLSKVGGAALLAAFGLLYGETGSFRFHDWAQAAPGLPGGVRAAVFLLLLVGFGTKVGLLPFQGPLPAGYAAAPGAASATLSIALNAGFYGLWRLVFDGLGPVSLWEGELVVALGAAGALVGVLYAIAQDELKRFLGFSSVEHAGIVLIGFGVALIGRAVDEPRLAAAGLLAATVHLLMHGLAKTLAFLGVDRVAAATGTSELEPLGGLAARLPRTAAGFGIAVLALAAVPPFAGFVGEWLSLEALLQAFRVGDTPARLLMALAAALLALTAGLALLAFAKLYGTVFLGRARRALPGLAPLPGPGAGLGALALAVLALGPAAPWEVRWLGRALRQPLGFDLSRTAVSHPLVLGPVYPHFSVLAPTWLAVALPGYALVTLVLVRILLRPSRRTAPVWASGTALRTAEVQYTPAAYSNPARVVLRGLYGYSRTLEPVPGARVPAVARLALETRVVPPFEHYLYRPLVAAALGLAARARLLQSGRLAAYLLYVLAVVLVVLALVPGLRR